MGTWQGIGTEIRQCCRLFRSGIFSHICILYDTNIRTHDMKYRGAVSGHQGVDMRSVRGFRRGKKEVIISMSGSGDERQG